MHIVIAMKVSAAMLAYVICMIGLRWMANTHVLQRVYEWRKRQPTVIRAILLFGAKDVEVFIKHQRWAIGFGVVLWTVVYVAIVSAIVKGG